MDILKAIAELKLTSARNDPSALEKFAELESAVQALLNEQTRREEEFAARLSTIRHQAAQPLTTLQLFLDLLPGVMRQENLVQEKLVNPNYWTHTYGRAQDAVKVLPKILEK